MSKSIGKIDNRGRIKIDEDYSSNFMPLFTKSPLVEEFVKRIIEIGKPVFRKMAKADTKELYKTQKRCKNSFTSSFKP